MIILCYLEKELNSALLDDLIGRLSFAGEEEDELLKAIHGFDTHLAFNWYIHFRG